MASTQGSSGLFFSAVFIIWVVIFFSRFYNMGSRGRISTPATSAANNPDRVILTDKPMRKYAAAKSN
jgi:hypothetical protein